MDIRAFGSGDAEAVREVHLLPLVWIIGVQLQLVGFLRKQVLILPAPLLVLCLPWVRCPVRHLPGSQLLLDQGRMRSEEHTSELQSRQYLVCRLLLEKKK